MKGNIDMSNTRTSHHPQCQGTQKTQVKASKTTQQVSRIKNIQHKTNTFALQKKAKDVQSRLHSSINTRQNPSAACPHTTQKSILHQLITDEVSSDDDDDPSDSDTESIEQINLTSENIKYRAADETRRNSYDSRHEADNELYKLDDFVVGDSGESERESVSSEITAMRRVSGCSLRPIPSVISVARRTSMRSTKSGCFVVDQDVESADDIVREIMDAMALLLRRCNRNLRPRKFVLAAETLDDEAMREVMDDAVRLGLSRLVSRSDGTEVWVIGPRS
jgi:hypothetical protein